MSYRFAIIGCGAIAARHAEQIKAVGVLSAVCDIDETRARRFGKDHGATWYFDIDTLLEKERIDVVVICTPNGVHPIHCVKALDAAIHVLCEKPLAISVADGKAMIEAAIRSGKKLFVVKQNRFNPPVAAVKKLLDTGRLGAIDSFQINCFWNRPSEYYRNSWRGTLALDGGTLYTQFSHFIDLLYWFLGDIQSVSGSRVNYRHKQSIAFEDTGVAHLTMKSGAVGTLQYTINAHVSNMEGSFTLFGKKGTLKIGGQYLNRIDYFSVDNELAPDTEGSHPANAYGHYQGSMANHHIIYSELIKALGDPGYTFVEADEALKSVEMIEQIYSASPLIEISSAYE